VAEPHAGSFPFTAQTRMSGVDFPVARSPARAASAKGAPDRDAHLPWTNGGGIRFPGHAPSLGQEASRRSRVRAARRSSWRRPRSARRGALKDVVKGGIKERFAHLRKMGIRTVMITGDNPLTAAAIAAEAGVDDFMAQATPEA
jgi:K+-transporting ATPase ATPase B chain